LSIAGIFDDWIEDNTGESFSTFSIITTEANDLMAGIHNSGKRMPVILDNSSETGWLDLSVKKEDALALLTPCPSDNLKAHTISPLINSRSSDRNTPDLILPYNYSTGNLLF
jgi:putative SOS response-associated peptidase YedK